MSNVETILPVKNHKLLTNIYMLVDTREPEIARYIGKADDLSIRLRKHIQQATQQQICVDTHKNKWIRSLIAENVLPEMILLKVVKKVDWEIAESNFIRLFKSFGAKLVNGTEFGGQGGPIRKGMKNKQSTIEKYKATVKIRGHHNKGRAMSEEQKEKIRAKHLGKKLSDEHRKAISKGITGERNPNFQGRVVTEYQRKIARRSMEKLLSKNKNR